MTHVTDLNVLSELYAHAAALERDMRYADASDAFLVLADAAEERGEAEDASSLRRRALRNYVTAWARQRWPREGIHVAHVFNAIIGLSSSRARRSRIDLTVRRRDAGRWEHVSVGRRGDVRLEGSSPLRFVAVGNDGLRPVVWGLGDTPEEAIADALAQDDGPTDATFLTVHPSTPAIEERVQRGDVSWRSTGRAQVD